MDAKYEALFTPWKIGNVEIKNRIVMCPMGGTSLFGWFELTGCGFDSDTLLPLKEWWGYLRNLAICLSFGFSAAIGSQLSRRGKFPWMSLVPPVLCLFLLTGRIGDFWLDIILTVLLIGFTIGYYFALKGGRDDEDL